MWVAKGVAEWLYGFDVFVGYVYRERWVGVCVKYVFM